MAFIPKEASYFRSYERRLMGLKCGYNQDVFLIKKKVLGVLENETKCVTKWDALVLATLR